MLILLAIEIGGSNRYKRLHRSQLFLSWIIQAGTNLEEIEVIVSVVAAAVRLKT